MAEEGGSGASDPARPCIRLVILLIAVRADETCKVGSLRRHCPDQVMEVAFRSHRPSSLSARPSTNAPRGASARRPGPSGRTPSLALQANFHGTPAPARHQGRTAPSLPRDQAESAPANPPCHRLPTRGGPGGRCPTVPPRAGGTGRERHRRPTADGGDRVGGAHGPRPTAAPRWAGRPMSDSLGLVHAGDTDSGRGRWFPCPPAVTTPTGPDSGRLPRPDSSIPRDETLTDPLRGQDWT